jgi:hypothetical protein
MAQKGMKSKIQFADTETYQDATTWTPFAKVIEIGPPPTTAVDINTTTLDTPDDYEDFDPGLADNGDSTFKLQWTPDQNETIYNMFRIKKGFRLLYSDMPTPSGVGSNLQFNGWIKGIAGESITKDNNVEATITVRVVGKPLYTKLAT